jgi:hypothetical protein
MLYLQNAAQRASKNEKLHNDTACIIHTKYSQFQVVIPYAVIRLLKCGPEMVFCVTGKFQNP